MWTWKTESAADWSMQAGITYGESLIDDAILAIPQDGYRHQSQQSHTGAESQMNVHVPPNS